MSMFGKPYQPEKRFSNWHATRDEKLEDLYGRQARGQAPFGWAPETHYE
jgi:hypothetical protein